MMLKKNEKIVSFIVIQLIIFAISALTLELYLKHLEYPDAVRMKQGDIAVTDTFENPQGDEIIVRTNILGMRTNHTPKSVENKKNKVLIFGDSQAWGWGVNEDESFISIAERQSEYTLINASQPGKEPEFYGLFIDKYLELYQPNSVVLMLFPNDVVGTTARENWIPEKIEYEKRFEKQFSVFPRLQTFVTYKVDKLKTIYKTKSSQSGQTRNPNLGSLNALLERSHLTASQKDNFVNEHGLNSLRSFYDNKYISDALLVGPQYPDFWQDSFDLESEVAKDKFEAMKKVVLYLRDASIARNVKFNVIYLPSPHEYSEQYYHNYYDLFDVVLNPEWSRGKTKQLRELEAFAYENDINFEAFLDDYIKFPDRHEMYFQIGDVHLNKLGNQNAAKVFLKYLRENASNLI